MYHIPPRSFTNTSVHVPYFPHIYFQVIWQLWELKGYSPMQLQTIGLVLGLSVQQNNQGSLLLQVPGLYCIMSRRTSLHYYIKLPQYCIYALHYCINLLYYCYSVALQCYSAALLHYCITVSASNKSLQLGCHLLAQMEGGECHSIPQS